MIGRASPLFTVKMKYRNFKHSFLIIEIQNLSEPEKFYTLGKNECEIFL